MSEVLQVEKREKYGKHHVRRMRDAGKLPAVLYGHGKPTVNLTVPAEQVGAAVRRGAKIVELAGEAEGPALMQELQWDIFSTHVLHLDLLRVKEGQRISITVPIELRGVALGMKDGGVIDHVLHEIEIETDISHVPEKLLVNINALELDASLTLAEIEDLPEGAIILSDTTKTVVQCITPTEMPEEEELPADGAEPEVIGEKAEESEDS